MTCRVGGSGPRSCGPALTTTRFSSHPSLISAWFLRSSPHHCPLSSPDSFLSSCNQSFLAMAAKDAKAQEAVRKLEEYIEKYVSLEVLMPISETHPLVLIGFTTPNAIQTMNTSIVTSSSPSRFSR